MHVISVLALMLAASPLAYAADIPPEGPIDSTFTWSEKPLTMPTAGGRDAFIVEEWMVVTAASTGSLLDKMAGRCLAMGDQSPDGSSYKQQGTCTLTDADGGKFEGVTGEHEITAAYYGTPAEGTVQGIGHKKGSYRIAK